MKLRYKFIFLGLSIGSMVLLSRIVSFDIMGMIFPEIFTNQYLSTSTPVDHTADLKRNSDTMDMNISLKKPGPNFPEIFTNQYLSASTPVDHTADLKRNGDTMDMDISKTHIKKNLTSKRILKADMSNASLPIIAVCIATTTRSMKKPSTDTMTLFTICLPSLMKTLDKGFMYRIYIAYDIGDLWWDVLDKSMFWDTFEEMRNNLYKRDIFISFTFVRFQNLLKKPGPIFNFMLKRAYDDGADFFFRINDDSEIKHPWAIKFRDFIFSRGLPYGVAGPWCNEGNPNILTHDFVHRTHMDIFKGVYYPPILSDWWMDDWITIVYGRNRTKRFSDVHTKHHVKIHGRRYEVNFEHKTKLVSELKKGRSKIAEWAISKDLPRVQEEFEKPLKMFNVLKGRI